MAFTKVVGPGIHTLAQLRTHNIHSAGIITATKFVGEMESGGGDSTFDSLTVTGNVSIGGTLQYEDVTNVESVGIITARKGINIGPADAGAYLTGIGASFNHVGDFITVGVSTFRGNLNLTAIGSGQANLLMSGEFPQILLNDTNNNSDYRIQNSNGTFQVKDDTNSAARFTINSGGTAAFKGNLDAEAGIDVSGSPAKIFSDLEVAENIRHINDTNTRIRFPSNDNITVETAGTERLRIGSIGISTFTEDVRIVKSGGPLLELTTNTGAADATLRLSEGATGSTSNGGGMFYSGADNKLHITCGTDSTTKRISILRDTGLVGIGTDNPVGNLEVRDTKANLIVAKTGLTVKSNSDIAATYDLIQLGAGGALASYSTATATADTQFIHNAYRHSGNNWKYRYDDTAMRLRMNSPGGAFIFESAASGSADGNITFSEKLRIDSSGNVGVNTDFTGSQAWRNGTKLEIYGGGGNVTGELHLGANRGDGQQSVGSINWFDNTQDSNHRQLALIEVDKSGTTSNKRGGDLLFYTKTDNVAAPTERLRIKNDGGLRLQKNDANGNFTISRNASVTTTNTAIGVLDFASNTAHTTQARVMGKTRGTSNVGGDLVVEARADGGSLDERFRITGSGLVGVNTATGGASSNAILSIHSPSSSACRFNLTNTGSSEAESTQIWSQNNDLVFNTDGDERLRINSDGRALFDRGAPGSANKTIARFQCESSRKLDIVWHDTGSLMGFDTPGSHAYIFKIGGSEKLRITSEGNFYVANQPSFSIKTVDANSFGTSGAHYNLSYASPLPIFTSGNVTTEHHVGSVLTYHDYVAGSNTGRYVKFTAPVAGNYLFGINAECNVAADDWMGFGFEINNSGTHNTTLERLVAWTHNQSAEDSTAQSRRRSFQASCLIRLAASDYVVPYQQSSSTATMQNVFRVWGMLVN